MLGLISIWMGDRLGIPAAVDIFNGIRISQLIIVLVNKNQISCIKSGNIVSILCLRPYHIESTSSRLITEVKANVGLISTWMGDAWEYQLL